MGAAGPTSRCVGIWLMSEIWQGRNCARNFADPGSAKKYPASSDLLGECQIRQIGFDFIRLGILTHDRGCILHQSDWNRLLLGDTGP